jgi:hypothetical protein
MQFLRECAASESPVVPPPSSSTAPPSRPRADTAGVSTFSSRGGILSAGFDLSTELLTADGKPLIYDALRSGSTRLVEWLIVYALATPKLILTIRLLVSSYGGVRGCSSLLFELGRAPPASRIPTARAVSCVPTPQAHLICLFIGAVARAPEPDSSS